MHALVLEYSGLTANPRPALAALTPRTVQYTRAHPSARTGFIVRTYVRTYMYI